MAQSKLREKTLGELYEYVTALEGDATLDRETAKRAHQRFMRAIGTRQRSLLAELDRVPRETPGTWVTRLSLRELADWLTWVEDTPDWPARESVRARIVAELDQRLGLLPA